MPSRQDHRRATLRRLSDAAVECFEARGPSATIDEIADRAGVARRTVFRYVDSKEELAFIHPVLWFDVFESALADAPEPALADRLRHASRAIALHIDDDPEPARRAFLVVAAHPELARGYSATFQRWIDRVAEEVVADIEEPTTHDRFRARVIGASTMGMVDAVVREWVSASPETSFTALYDEGFAVLAPLLPHPH